MIGGTKEEMLSWTCNKLHFLVMNPFMVFFSYEQLRSSMRPLFAGRIFPPLFSLRCKPRRCPAKARRDANAAGVLHDANSVDRFLHDDNSVNISRDANTANIYLTPSRCHSARVLHDANSVDRFLHDANSVNISRDANTANIYLSPSRCQFREGFPRCQFRGHFIAMPIPRRTLTMPIP